MNKLDMAIYIGQIIVALALSGCGTGPWYIQKTAYNTYKEPIYQNAELKIRTDGYYAQLSTAKELDLTKNVLIFTHKGYTSFVKYNDLKHSMVSQQKLYKDLDWWILRNDSILIENYGESKRQMKTMVWWYKGTVLNDSIIELSYQDEHYKYEPLQYQFIQSDHIPELKNNARYLKKKWYQTNLNKQRK